MKTNRRPAAALLLPCATASGPLLCLALLAFFSLSAMAGTFQSTTAGGLWTTAGTWTNNAVPGTTDDVIIATTGASQVTLGASTSVATVTINLGATLGFNNDNITDRTLTLAGNLANNGTITLGTGGGTSPTGRITFSGAGRTWTGSGDVSLVKIRLTVNSGGSLDISGLTIPLKFRNTGTQQFAVNGTLITGTQVIDGNGNTTQTYTFGASSSLVTGNPNGIYGAGATFSTVLAPVFTAGASVTFNGSAAQVTTGLPATIASLTINNSGAGVTLSQATTVTNLTLTAGKLTTTAANLLTIAAGGTGISGGSASSYVNGPLAQVYTAAGAKTFPIGVSPNFRAVTNDITVLSGTPTITITPYEPSTFSCSAPDGYAVSALRNWKVASSVAGPQMATLTVDGTGYGTASTLIQCVAGTATALPTSSPSANIFQAALVSLGTSQEFALGEVCVSVAPSLTSASDAGACTAVAVVWVTDGTSSYKIYRKTGAGSYGLLASGLTSSPYNDSSVVGNTTYTYAVAAVATCGAESPKAEFSPLTTTTGKPATPAQPTITTNCGSLTVNWAATPGATTYNVYRKLSTDSGYGAAIATGKTGTSFTDLDATDFTKIYVYAVSGVDVCEGFLSPDSTGAAPAFPPSISSSPASSATVVLGTTTNLTVVATGTGLTYQWQVDKGSGFVNAVESTDGTGTTTATFTNVAASASMNGYQYQCVVGGTCSPAQTTSPTTLITAIYVRSAFSGSIATATNFEMSVDGSTGWIVANSAPNSNCVTTIRNSHSFTNTNPSERQVRSLTLDAGGQLLNGNGTTVRNFAIFGSLTNNGALLSGGGANAHHLYFRGSGNWMGSGDLSTGGGGMDITVDSGVTVDASGLTTPIKMHGTVVTPFTVNGTLNAGSLTIKGNGNAASVFTLSPGATLVSANPNGLTGAAATLNFVVAPSLSTAANYSLNGGVAQVTTGLPATVNNLTIANNSAAGVVLSAGVAVNGTLAVNAGATLDFNSQTVTLAAAPSLNGAVIMEVNKTGPNTFTGSKLTRAGGELPLSGGLTLTASGAALEGGDVVDLFDASSFSGSLDATNLPSLGTGLNWWLGNLTVDGSLVVNRAPTASDKNYTRAAGTSLTILKSDLLVGASDPDSGDSVSFDALTSPGSQGATVSENATSILYEPANNNGDTLAFRVKDTRGGSVVKNITITVDNSSAGGVAQSITPAAGGIAVTFAGIPTLKYDVERADDVNFAVNLTTLITTNAPANGIFTVIDNGPPQASAYYRLKFNPN